MFSCPFYEKYHLHDYDKNINLHFRIETVVHCREYHRIIVTETPTCINTIKIITHIFDDETYTCISDAETATCSIDYIQELSLAEMAPARDSVSYNRN